MNTYTSTVVRHSWIVSKEADYRIGQNARSLTLFYISHYFIICIVQLSNYVSLIIINILSYAHNLILNDLPKADPHQIGRETSRSGIQTNCVAVETISATNITKERQCLSVSRLLVRKTCCFKVNKTCSRYLDRICVRNKDSFRKLKYLFIFK